MFRPDDQPAECVTGCPVTYPGGVEHAENSTREYCWNDLQDGDKKVERQQLHDALFSLSPPGEASRSLSIVVRQRKTLQTSPHSRKSTYLPSLSSPQLGMRMLLASLFRIGLRHYSRPRLYISMNISLDRRHV